MKTQDNKLTAKEIKESILPIVFGIEYDNDTGHGDGCFTEWWETVGGKFSNEIDAIAAFNAVKNTYGKNLDPEVYEDVVIFFEKLFCFSDESLNVFANGSTLITFKFLPIDFKNALEALKKARI